MVFVVAHFNSLVDAQAITDLYVQKYTEVVLCGSANFEMQKNNTLAYHPIFLVEAQTTIAQQHAYIDAMLRAIQIEVPEAVIFHSPTMFDTNTVLFRIKEHCNTVNVKILEN